MGALRAVDIMMIAASGRGFAKLVFTVLFTLCKAGKQVLPTVKINLIKQLVGCFDKGGVADKPFLLGQGFRFVFVYLVGMAYNLIGGV